MADKSDIEAAKKAVTKWEAKRKAATASTKTAVDALQKHIQTKNVKRLMTTEGAYKKRVPINVVSGSKPTTKSGSGYKFYAGGGKATKGLGRAFSKGGKV